MLFRSILSEQGLTLATAESCTGGVIASKFTAIAGASVYFQGGVVAYSNELKIKALGVSREDILLHGAVSREVVEQMAQGVRELTGADYAIATSGIAGPTGGTAEKPVGTVWFAIATPTGVRSQMRNSGSVRSQIIERASGFAIRLLLEDLKAR